MDFVHIQFAQEQSFGEKPPEVILSIYHSPTVSSSFQIQRAELENPNAQSLFPGLLFLQLHCSELLQGCPDLFSLYDLKNSSPHIKKPGHSLEASAFADLVAHTLHDSHGSRPHNSSSNCTATCHTKDSSFFILMAWMAKQGTFSISVMAGIMHTRGGQLWPQGEGHTWP